MSKQRELLRRIAALETRVAALECRQKVTALVATPRIARIVDAAAVAFGTTSDAIIGQSKKMPEMMARLIVYGLARELTEGSLNTIAAQLGKRDHNSVLLGSRSCQNLRDTQDSFAATYNTLRDALKKEFEVICPSQDHN